MNWIKRLAWFFAILLILPIFAFWGFQMNFPGKSLADALSLRLTSHTGIPNKIEDVALGWTGLSIPEIALKTPNWMVGIPKVRMLVFEQLQVSFWPLISQQKVVLSGKMHEGTFELSTDALTQESLDFSLNSVALGRIPASAAIPYALVTGELNSKIHIENLKALVQKKTMLAKGSMDGSLKNIFIRFAGGGLIDPNYSLPEIELTQVDFETELDQVLIIRKVQVAGSLNGNVDGTIQLDPQRPGNSKLDLNITLTPSSELKVELAGLAPMLRSLQCGDTINIRLTGTLKRPNFPVRRNCS